MAKLTLGKRIISAVLALVMVIGMCPTMVLATGAKTEVLGSNSTKLPFTKVEDIDADLLHDATKVTQPEEEPPYADTDMVRVSIQLNK